jgi:prephenate dehydrogenase
MIKTVGIIGLGLMGGSLGLSLKGNNYRNRNNYKILGYDRNSIHVKDALKYKLVDEVVPFLEIQNVDILFLAIPVNSILKTIRNFSNLKQNITIVDFGSTKLEIAKNIPPKIRKNFVLAHPMAGTEKSGPLSAFKGLYKNNIVVLCDIEKSGEIHKQKTEKILEILEMNIRYMDSESHDLHTAWISHLPHIISFSLANSVMSQEDSNSILDLSAGGFRDMSRLAKSSPKMWKDIAKQNKTNLLNSITQFEKELQDFKHAIQNSDWDKLETKMKLANRLDTILK